MAMFRTNDNTETHYTVTGEGRPLLLLPGWTCTAKFWRKNAPALAERCRVIQMDMRAHGLSENVLHGHRNSISGGIYHVFGRREGNLYIKS